MRKILNELKAFIAKGNVIDLAIGILMGAAFQAIVSSFVQDVISPVIGLAVGIDFENLILILKGKESYPSKQAALDDEAVFLGVGTLINTVINFLIVALFCFVLTKLVLNLQKEEEKKPETKVCEYCKNEIKIAATRCPKCEEEQ